MPVVVSNLGMSEEDSPDNSQQKLLFIDNGLSQETLTSLDLMRRNRQFCDVILQVDNIEIHAHRAVLASASPYLFEWFNEEENKRERIFKYHLNGKLDKVSLQTLVDYAYTSRLEIEESKVQGVYLAACLWRMDKVKAECGKWLLQNLRDDNCIQLRSLLSSSKDYLAESVDNFIAEKMSGLVNSNQILQLPRVSVEVLHITKEDMVAMNSQLLASMVLDWMKDQMHDKDFTMDTFTEKNHLLYISVENCLKDCSDSQNNEINELVMVQDYRNMSRKHSHGAKARKRSSQPSKPRHMLYIRKISDEAVICSHGEDWKVIAVADVADFSIVALVTVSGVLCSISIQSRANPSATSSPAQTPPQKTSRPPSLEKADCYALLSKMSYAKCAVGAAALNKKLFTCGGYDRGECLRNCEEFDPLTNTWTTLAPMCHPRGRFDLTVVDGNAYAVGGSDGIKDLNSVEFYDSENNCWTLTTPLPEARSSAGVSSLDGEIYCIGGQVYQAGSKNCHKYNPDTKSWTSIAPMHTGRYQAGVCAYNGEVYVVGGCESWSCLASVEIYNPSSNSWRLTAPMITARRGCGVVVLQDKLWVVGGSDGSHCLCTTEIFDLVAEVWIPGPNLTTCRANVASVVVDDKIFAIGGYSGKAFLNTIEYYTESTGEWTTFLNMDEAVSEEDSESSSESAQEAYDSSPDTPRVMVPQLPNGVATNNADISCGSSVCIGL